MSPEAAKTFKETVRSMTAKEIIMAMVEGLRNPSCRVDMSTFGHILLDEKGDRVCFGCAATNATALIAGIDLTPSNINQKCREEQLCPGDDELFVMGFECAIDHLRNGNIEYYNEIANFTKIAKIKNPLEIDLPFLRDSNYLSKLYHYEALANSQEN